MDRRIVVESLNTPEEEGSVVFHSPKVCRQILHTKKKKKTQDRQRLADPKQERKNVRT